MNIGIIGQGFVGNAIYQKFKNYYNVKTYDIKGNIHCNSNEQETLDNEVVFICLPTPMRETGECDISIVAGVLDKIVNLKQPKIVVIKSTVPPLTVESLNNILPDDIQVVFNPEFLTERNAVEDYNNQKRIILGGPRPATTT